MKFAPVCPIHIYEYLDQTNPQALGDYFLLLAHDVLANQARYEAFFKNRECTIIMDNSVIELGTACGPATLIEAAETVNADVIAIPDVLLDGIATYRTAKAFIDNYQGRFPLMYIPQGNSLRDYLTCVDSMFVSFAERISWIGVARNTVGRVVNSRRHLIAYLISKRLQEVAFNNSRRHIMNPHSIHLLGFSVDNVDDVATCLTFRDEIEGIDSAVPLRMATPFNTAEEIVDPGPRGDWWETVQPTPLMVDNLMSMRKLIGEAIRV